MGGLPGLFFAKQITNFSTLGEMVDILISFYVNKNQSQSLFINTNFHDKNSKLCAVYCFYFFSKGRNGIAYCCSKTVFSKKVIAKHLDLLSAVNGV